ncbi:unnamed protein product [Urochloa humidicola]
MPWAPPARARPTIPSALLQTQLPPPRQSRPPTDEEIDADTAACGRICLEFEPGKHLHQINGGFFAAKKRSSRHHLLLQRLLLSALRMWPEQDQFRSARAGPRPLATVRALDGHAYHPDSVSLQPDPGAEGLALVLLHAYLFSLHHAMRSLMHPACNIMKIELGRHEIVSMCRG